jgi:predicted aldo/keto reductase-like oxidoreductase
MEYATLGNTGLLVSKLCLGTMTFGDDRGFFKAIGAVGQAGADELVKTSIDGGINFFGARPRQRSAWPAQPRHDGRCLKAEGQRRCV